MIRYMAHSPSGENSEWQTLKAHAEGVTIRLEHHLRYLSQNMPELLRHAKLIGYLHDLGKYREDFQKYRLTWNPETGKQEAFTPRKVPHSDAGAKAMQYLLDMDRETASELPFVIASHHGRLQDVDSLNTRLDKTDLTEIEPLLELAMSEIPEISDLLAIDLTDLPLEKTERAFLIRLLLGALVDADRLDTEEHGSPSKTELRAQHAAEQNEMALLLARVEVEQDKKAAKDALNPQSINALRREMYTDAVSHAADPAGFFRLTMPTGGGKTLTSLAFALGHAQHHSLRRVVYAVPFTTIIDQTAKEFRRVLERGNDFKVLEHHSNMEIKGLKEGNENQTTAPELATENWDAPVVVTTTVRLFQETLFGTRTAQLRRLHNLSGSVIVLDEAQSLPTHLLEPTLDALQFLVKYARCSVVLCTATQPALDEQLGFPVLEDIRDLVAETTQYFDALKRVEYEFRLSEPTQWAELAHELKQKDQVLCIVNTRQHAKDLYTLLGDEASFHLSTNMCPAHRKRELETIRQRLSIGQPCRVVSTQLIEAGIDVDFPAVYRAMGPLEAIVQAAGRCNREGLLKDDKGELTHGDVVVFLPVDHNMPMGDYQVRTGITDTELKEGKNLHDPAVFSAYFREVYSRVSLAPKVKIYGGETPFQKAHAQLYFGQVANAYQMIEGEMVPVIIRGHDKDRVDKLLTTICNSRDKRERREAWRGLQQYTVNLYQSQAKKLAHLLSGVPELEARARWLGIEPPEIREWPISARYDDKLGLVPDFNIDRFAIF